MSLDGATELLMAVGLNQKKQLLVVEKLKQWEWFEQFMVTNPDIKERWEQHKTYEILKDEHVK